MNDNEKNEYKMEKKNSKGNLLPNSFEEKLEILQQQQILEKIHENTNKNQSDWEDKISFLQASYKGKIDVIELLIKKGININIQDNDFYTPLHYAISGRQIETIKYLLQHGANPNLKDTKGYTSLHIAVLENQLKAAMILINYNVDINSKDLEGMTPIHHACSMGYIDFVKFLLEQKEIQINDVDNHYSSPLHKACYNGYLECVKILIENGAKINYTNKFTSPLHHASFGGHASCVEFLLKNGADIHCVDLEQATALHKASFQGYSEVVELLINYGADINAQDEEGSTPLHKAAFSGKTKVMTILLKNGAEVDSQDNDDGTPLHNACFNGHLDCVKLLLIAQANLNCADSKGASPLHLAVLNGHREVASLLVESGAQVDTPDDRGMTALHHAIGYTSCLSFLLDKGAEVDCTDNLGRTPLFYACKNSCSEPSRFLILKGANVYLKDKNGLSPFTISNPSFQKFLLNVLKEREQQVDVETQKKYQIAAKLFNQKPQKGIDYLITNEVIKDDPQQIAKFLHKAEGLNKSLIGDLLGYNDTYNIQLLNEFVKSMDFSGLDFDDALRYFLSKFVLPGEAQKIDRIMEKFAARYCENNPGIFIHQGLSSYYNLIIKKILDSAYILAFSLIMLNTDAHSPRVKNKMTKEQFLKNNRGIIGVSNEMMSNLYDKIVQNEIKLDYEVNVFTSAEKKGWCNKQGGRIKTWKKRWFVLKDNCLYYFKTSDNESNPCGIIPLENLLVRTIETKNNKRNYVFEVYSENGEIKSCKLSNGQLVKGHHGSYLISAPSQQEMESWISCIKNNIAFNPLFEMIKKRMKGQEEKNYDLGKAIDIQELHDACLMCSMCYKSTKAIKEAYGVQTFVNTTQYNMKYFLITNERIKSQTLVLCQALSESILNENIKSLEIFQQFNFDKTIPELDSKLIKLLKKDFQLNIFGHSLGGAFCLLFALHLQTENFKIGKIITFGQPKIIKERDISSFKNFSVIRVIDYYDPIPNHIFLEHIHIGPCIVLFEGTYYSYLPHDLQENIQEQKFDHNHIESYLRNLKNKMKKTNYLTWDEKNLALNFSVK